MPTAQHCPQNCYSGVGAKPLFTYCFIQHAHYPGGAHSLMSHELLDTFPNPQADRDYSIHIEIPEFTCLCPKTAQPDYATISLDYVPDESCIELKSLKIYIASFRDQGAFHEAVTNRILNDLVTVCQPRFLRISSRFNVRGGIYTTVVVEHRDHGWQPAPPVNIP